jgi:hypothetical protein
MIRYYGLYANAYRGKKRKTGEGPSHPPIIDDEVSFFWYIFGIFHLTEVYTYCKTIKLIIMVRYSDFLAVKHIVDIILKGGNNHG